MYIRIRNIAGGTHMTCKDCGHAISVNKICERPKFPPDELADGPQALSRFQREAKAAFSLNHPN